MRGIAVTIAPTESAVQMRPVLRGISDPIVHGRPDGGGHVVDDGAGSGMLRVSVIDRAGAQHLIVNESGDIHVLCSGEINIHRELQAKRVSPRQVFCSSSDTEVIVQLDEEIGGGRSRQLRETFGADALRADLRPQGTFTIVSSRRDSDESADTLRVARYFDTEYHVLEFSVEKSQAKAADALLQWIRNFDEPFGEASALPPYHVSRLARDHMTVIN